MPAGLGASKWGLAQWGTGTVPPVGPPVIEPLYPVDGTVDVSQGSPLFIRFTDDSFVDQATLSISVGPTVYVFGGVAQNGATLIVTPNAGNGFDVELRAPTPYPLDTTIQVVVSVKDDASNIAGLSYWFSVGVGLRLLKVRNPEPNVLVAHYNRALLQDAKLRSVASWTVTPVSEGARPLEITEVSLNPLLPDVVTFRYQGGGSTYELSNLFVYDKDGSQVDAQYAKANFRISFPDDPAPTVRLFNSVFGPMGVVHQQRFRLTIDNHVITRSIAAATKAQTDLRAKNLDGSAGRDGRPGTKRT